MGLTPLYTKEYNFDEAYPMAVAFDLFGFRWSMPAREYARRSGSCTIRDDDK